MFKTISKTISLAVLIGTLLLFQTSCKNRPSGDANSATDTISVAEELPPLKGDEKINLANQFYAGISKEGITMSEKDSEAWDKYSKQIADLMTKSNKTISWVDSIAKRDFSDFRDDVDYVFYPFSGADFIYPTTLYPNAETYFLCGLERTGTPISSELKTNYSHYEAYRSALSTFLSRGYFITKEMSGDFHNKELDGVCPVITMLMAIRGYEIISIKHMNLNGQGVFVEAQSKSNILEIKFFRSGSNQEKTLYYISGDVQDKSINPNLKTYLDNTLPKHKVGSYLKAASFLLHWNSFSTMRNYILDFSIALVEDDSGIPYRYLKDGFDITLYGKYKYPSNEFSKACGQPDLEELYNKKGNNITPMPFRLGYNVPSNWLCARKKVAKADNVPSE